MEGLTQAERRNTTRLLMCITSVTGAGMIHLQLDAINIKLRALKVSSLLSWSFSKSSYSVSAAKTSFTSYKYFILSLGAALTARRLWMIFPLQ